MTFFLKVLEAQPRIRVWHGFPKLLPRHVDSLGVLDWGIPVFLRMECLMMALDVIIEVGPLTKFRAGAAWNWAKPGFAQAVCVIVVVPMQHFLESFIANSTHDFSILAFATMDEYMSLKTTLVFILFCAMSAHEYISCMGIFMPDYTVFRFKLTIAKVAWKETTRISDIS